MIRTMYFSKHRFFAIFLFFPLLLGSCSGPGKKTLGDAESLVYLECPIIPDTVPVIPPGPYNEDIGDCALVGKSEEIEAWLTGLESIAESCRANREPNWADTLAVRDNLDAKIDGLSSFDGSIYLPVCGAYSDSDSSSPSNKYETDFSQTDAYTNWLKRIGKDVEEYCTMIDGIIKPLSQACDEINFYQDCQVPDPEQYHSIIKWKMNAAQIHYDYTETFYTNNLEIDGWGKFRTEFNESSLANDCPREQQATFTFTINAFCRVGPTLKYEKVATFLEGQSVQIFGRNQSEPRWWWVQIPGTSEHCWASDSTGTAAGNLEDLETVAAPPLVISPVKDNQEKDQPQAKVCSKDLDPRACAAAGGTWTQSSLGPYYCDCK